MNTAIALTRAVQGLGDRSSELLPLSQVGGYVLGARALTLTGVAGTVAAASTIVDVTLEFVSQLAYTVGSRAAATTLAENYVGLETA